jgi:hypothetical protein
MRHDTSQIQGLFTQTIPCFTLICHDVKFKNAQHPKVAAQRQSDHQVSRRFFASSSGEKNH